jgi:hypothetical protein
MLQDLQAFGLSVNPCFATQLVKQDYSTTHYLRNDCFATRPLYAVRASENTLKS